ncbi:MAG: uracil-DNA glycosylase, partial [Blastocatellia bacterium]|nr:uracil-DNA glycosylase [Blastocatellia bacterium]
TGLTRQDIFITNAVMCNPREGEKNSKPLSSEITNCRPFLLRQIELLQPPVIATLGAVALMALDAIEPHGLKLDPDAGKAFRWRGRSLVPLYHPSPHVVNGRRRKQQQIADYKAITEALEGMKR